MITGYVSDRREAVIPIRVLDAEKQWHGIEGIIDTGFTGFLTLPPLLINQWQLSWQGFEQATLADGQVSTFEVYQAEIEWHGAPRRVEVDATESIPLIGMGLLYGSALFINIVSDGIVTVEKRP